MLGLLSPSEQHQVLHHLPPCLAPSVVACEPYRMSILPPTFATFGLSVQKEVWVVERLCIARTRIGCLPALLPFPYDGSVAGLNALPQWPRRVAQIDRPPAERACAMSHWYEEMTRCPHVSHCSTYSTWPHFAKRSFSHLRKTSATSSRCSLIVPVEWRSRRDDEQ